jgi:hypothetical protein
MRIYELSKKININNKEILAKLAEMGIQAKSHMSNIDKDTTKKLTDIFAKKQEKAKVKKKPVSPGEKEKAARPAAPGKAVKVKAAVKPGKKEKPIYKIKAEKPVTEKT